MKKPVAAMLGAMLTVGLASAAPAIAQYRQNIDNDLGRCSAGAGPAVRVAVQGVASSSGTVRVQIYRGTQTEWLKKGRWLSRIEVPARKGAMAFCVPVAEAGKYAVAVRHDVNGNGKTELSQDGGGMSNNPAFSIFNMGKPPISKTVFQVGEDVKPIQIGIKYM